MVKLGIISRDNGWGLSKDVRLLMHLWGQRGFDVTFIDNDTNPPVIQQRAIFHNELVNGKYWRKATHSILIPNQEWFQNNWLNSRMRFSGVWCKTKHAQEIFSNYGFSNIRFLGFTTESKNLGIPFQDKKVEFIHVAGNSKFKGTDAVIEAWRNNPQFPKIHVFNVYGDLTQRVKDIKNLEYYFGFQPEEELNQVRNETLFHLQPSDAEGFGHVIYEGLSMGNIVITTNAPPMNEIKPAVLVKINHHSTSTHGLGTRFHVNPEAVANGVKQMLKMENQWEAVSKESLRFYLNGQQQFYKNFNKLTKEFIG